MFSPDFDINLPLLRMSQDILLNYYYYCIFDIFLTSVIPRYCHWRVSDNQSSRYSYHSFITLAQTGNNDNCTISLLKISVSYKYFAIWKKKTNNRNKAIKYNTMYDLSLDLYNPQVVSYFKQLTPLTEKYMRHIFIHKYLISLILDDGFWNVSVFDGAPRPPALQSLKKRFVDYASG